MKIVIAPDSFKGSLTAKEAADSIENGIKKVLTDAETIKVPMADGGEGTVQSLVDCTKGELINIKVRDPLYRLVDSYYGILGDGKTAVIEMAAASGLPLLTDAERDPMKTTTYGTGQLIKDALQRGCSEIIIGLGGSATNDGGTGMLQALGAKFTDVHGYEVGFGGENLSKIKHIDLSKIDKRIKQCRFTAACDVENPLYGESGAAYVFAQQKGASEQEIGILDSNLKYYAGIIKEELGISVDTVKGAGAAGGLGAAVMAFLNADIKKGIDIVVDLTSLEDKLKDADLVITGEGMIDFQTAFGKTPFGVAQTAKKYNIPVIALAGGLGKNISSLYSKGIDSIFSIVNKPMSLQDSMINSKELISDTIERVIRLIIKFNHNI